MSRPSARPARSTVPVSLDDLPGHYIRRLQQIAVAVFLQETGAQAITPVQFAALHAVASQPGLDQRTLAGTIGFDTSTIGGVVDRLESRGLLERSNSPSDRRVRLLTLTREGQSVLAAAVPGVLRAQERMLAPLSKGDRAEFVRMLRLLAAANNEHSRAPSALEPP